MRLGLLAVPLLAVAACTRPNSGFDEHDSEGSTEGSGPEPTSDSAKPPDGTGPEPGTGGSSVSDSADVTSVGPTTEGSATGTTSNTSNSTAESGDCTPDVWALEPIADTFVTRSDGPWCNGLYCQNVNFGSAAEGPIEDIGAGFQSYLLMSFDLSEVPVPQTSLTATLEVSVVNGMPILVQALEVFPMSWSEGDGTGIAMAGGGQATWLWSANPDPWVPPGNPGSFELVLLSAAEIGNVNGAAGLEPHALFIALDEPTVAGWFEGPDLVHLAVTVTDSAGEAGARTRESLAPPVLTFEGC